MSASGLAYDRYSANGFDEWIMRVGAADAPAILFLPPLFEELNRTRAMIAGAMRRLAALGWGCWLPDLPGTGESERPLETCGLEDWREAAGAAAAKAAGRGRLAGVATVRGGCLFEAGEAPVWRLSPVDGAALVRDLGRAGLAGEGAGGGYAPSADLLEALAAAAPIPAPRLRTLRLATDPAAADLKLDCPPLWRRAEPQAAPELAERIAADIDRWLRACGA